MFEVAIVGAGGMAGTHARGYAAIPEARVVGVMDIREDAAKTLAEAHGARPYTDFARMIEETTPDVVDVCTPTPFHLEYVRRAAEAKVRGIVVEKPMGRTAAECEEMIAVCQANGSNLFVAHVLRFFPEFATATAQVEAGAVGEVAAVRTKRGGPYPRGWDDWFGKVDWSGGVIMDLIIHDFDWLRWTFGDVERVFAKSVAAKAGPGAVVDKDYALVTLRFKSGVMAHVEGTWADPSGFKVGLEIAGDKGLLEYNFNQPGGAPLIVAAEAVEGQRAGVAIPESPTALNPYQAELEHFLECLETGKKPLISPADGLEAVRIAEAAIESARTGQLVVLS
jgi:UDP-N-acetylglucosamine 3-dehydrogenase